MTDKSIKITSKAHEIVQEIKKKSHLPIKFIIEMAVEKMKKDYAKQFTK